MAKEETFFTQSFDQLVPKNDKYRTLKENLNLSFINELARPFYGNTGPDGYPPEQLFKMLVVMYIEGISSERSLENEINFNIRYRYFCNLDLMQKAPDHSTFSVLRTRLGDILFLEILNKLVEEAFNLGFIRAQHLAIDSTTILADCAIPYGKKESDDEDEEDKRKRPLSSSKVDEDAR